jgi:hypothetical protein
MAKNREAWRCDAAFICALSIAPAFTTVVAFHRTTVGMTIEDDVPEIEAAHYPLRQPSPIDAFGNVDLSSTGVNSLVAFHGIPAFDIWEG